MAEKSLIETLKSIDEYDVILANSILGFAAPGRKTMSGDNYLNI